MKKYVIARPSLTGGNTAYYCGLCDDFIREKWEYTKDNAVQYTQKEVDAEGEMVEGEVFEEL